MKSKPLNIGRNHFWLGGALAAGACVAVCSAPIFLWMVGAGMASSLLCTPREALTVAGISGLAVAALFAIHRWFTAPDCSCADRAVALADGDQPIACDLTVFDSGERSEHIALAKELLAQARRIIEHTNGFTFVFDKSPVIDEQIANWVSKEKKCCPFFSFEVTTVTTPPSLNLRIDGPEGTKNILKAELQNIRLLTESENTQRA